MDGLMYNIETLTNHWADLTWLYCLLTHSCMGRIAWEATPTCSSGSSSCMDMNLITPRPVFVSATEASTSIKTRIPLRSPIGTLCSALKILSIHVRRCIYELITTSNCTAKHYFALWLFSILSILLVTHQNALVVTHQNAQKKIATSH